MRKIYISLLYIFISFNCYSAPGRPVTPYFDAIEYYDFVIKGNIIDMLVLKHSHDFIHALCIHVTNNFDQDINDTIWIYPQIAYNETISTDFSSGSGNKYFAVKKIDNRFIYHPGSPYSVLDIEDKEVKGLFTSLDVFIQTKLFRSYNSKLSINRFERKLSKILRRKSTVVMP